VKILVTGGNGFIGRHIVRELWSRGLEVVAFDTVPPKETLKGVHYATGTVMDEISLGKRLKGCDAVFHLAAVLGVRRADENLLYCLHVNLEGTIKVLNACVMNQVPRVLITSSSEIFGDITNSKVSETAPFNPKSGYAVSKLAAEHYAEAFRREFGIDYNIVRFFNIYGPGQVAEFVVPRFARMVQQGIAPRIYGDGEQVRSFCYIEDAARGTVDAFLNDRARNEALNIGNDREPISVKDLAGKVVTKLGSDLEPIHVPFAESDRAHGREIFYRVPDISKISELIGYEPKISLDEGLDRLIAGGEIPESWIEPLDGEYGK
jgi:UDP-glucose 4-epimerase